MLQHFSQSVIVPTSKGNAMLIDRADLCHIEGRTIYEVSGYPTIKLKRDGRWTLVAVHTLLLDPALDTIDRKRVRVTHLNGNRLDCRRANLAALPIGFITSRSRRNPTHYRGVYRARNKWTASITFQRRRIHLGVHATAEQAAAAYDEMALKLYGEHAYQNFPDRHEIGTEDLAGTANDTLSRVA